MFDWWLGCIKGVQTAEADFTSGKITVTGTMDPNKLVDYVYKHTKKQARIITKPEPQLKLEPEPKPEPEPQQEEKGADADADTDDSKKPADAEPEQDGGVKGGQEKQVKKEDAINGDGEKGNRDDNAPKEETDKQPKQESGDEDEKKMMIMTAMPQIQPTMPSIPYYHYYQPIYVIERVPPPYPPAMFFSDENPNACCVS